MFCSPLFLSELLLSHSLSDWTLLVSVYSSKIVLRLTHNMLTFAGLAKNEFQLVLWVSSSQILLAQGRFLLVLVNDFVRG